MKINFEKPVRPVARTHWKDLTPGLWQDENNPKPQHVILVLDDDNIKNRVFIDAGSCEMADGWDNEFLVPFTGRLTLENGNVDRT